MATCNQEAIQILDAHLKAKGEACSAGDCERYLELIRSPQEILAFHMENDEPGFNGCKLFHQQLLTQYMRDCFPSQNADFSDCFREGDQVRDELRRSGSMVLPERFERFKNDAPLTEAQRITQEIRDDVRDSGLLQTWGEFYADAIENEQIEFPNGVSLKPSCGGEESCIEPDRSTIDQGRRQLNIDPGLVRRGGIAAVVEVLLEEANLSLAVDGPAADLAFAALILRGQNLEPDTEPESVGSVNVGGLGVGVGGAPAAEGIASVNVGDPEQGTLQGVVVERLPSNHPINNSLFRNITDHCTGRVLRRARAHVSGADTEDCDDFRWTQAFLAHLSAALEGKRVSLSGRLISDRISPPHNAGAQESLFRCESVVEDLRALLGQFPQDCRGRVPGVSQPPAADPDTPDPAPSADPDTPDPAPSGNVSTRIEEWVTAMEEFLQATASSSSECQNRLGGSDPSVLIRNRTSPSSVGGSGGAQSVEAVDEIAQEVLTQLWADNGNVLLRQVCWPCVDEGTQVSTPPTTLDALKSTTQICDFQAKAGPHVIRLPAQLANRGAVRLSRSHRDELKRLFAPHRASVLKQAGLEGQKRVAFNRALDTEAQECLDSLLSSTVRSMDEIHAALEDCARMSLAVGLHRVKGE